FSNLNNELYNSIEHQLSVPKGILIQPSVEVFNNSYLTRTVLNPNDDDDSIATINKLVNRVEEINSSTFEKAIVSLNPSFANVWYGALQSIETENPEKARHFLVSLRELFTRILKALAPDEKIRKWSNDASLYQNDKPTRKARILYLNREINSTELSSFIEKDIDSILEFWTILQKGTHSIDFKLTDRQLNGIKLRFESTVKFLIDIERQS
ncbi:MAG: hypothetical protein AB1728_14795, partial [Bacteroidota bacterium]